VSDPEPFFSAPIWSVMPLFFKTRPFFLRKCLTTTFQQNVCLGALANRPPFLSSSKSVFFRILVYHSSFRPPTFFPAPPPVGPRFVYTGHPPPSRIPFRLPAVFSVLPFLFSRDPFHRPYDRFRPFPQLFKAHRVLASDSRTVFHGPLTPN